ncbi:MAG: dienelactone hydrolase [Sphingobacteriales bacterium]|nr:MAG: dienelactone hydrolase [Sphingobacteriales bacterium]
MEILKNLWIEGSDGRTMLADIFYKKTFKPKPIIVFVHGFKGFKDWGAFNEIAEWYARQGFIYVKFNFSHNGTTPDKATEFADLEAFGNNNFSKELFDLDRIISYIYTSGKIPSGELEKEKLYLIGHSRGGGIAILKAAKDDRVKKLATWAAVNDFGYAWDEERVMYWKMRGVMHVENARTKQRLPLYYQLYENYIQNKEKLHIPNAVKILQKPFLVIHGTEDEAVDFSHALEMKRWNANIKLDLIPHANHVFGVKHPHKEIELPFDLRVAMEHTRDFFMQK